MKSLNSKGTTGGTPNTMLTKLSSPQHTHTKRMWEIGLSLCWYFVTECRSIQVIGQGSGRESPHGSRNFQRTRRALKERERERERERRVSQRNQPTTSWSKTTLVYRWWWVWTYSDPGKEEESVRVWTSRMLKMWPCNSIFHFQECINRW